MAGQSRGTAVAAAAALAVVLARPVMAGAQAPARPQALGARSLVVDIRPDRDEGVVIGHAASVRDLLADIARRAGFEILYAERIPDRPIDAQYDRVSIQVIVSRLLGDAGVSFVMAGRVDRAVPSKVMIAPRPAGPSLAAVTSPSGGAAIPGPTGLRQGAPAPGLPAWPAAEEAAARPAVGEGPPVAMSVPEAQPAWVALPVPYQMQPVRLEDVVMPAASVVLPPVPAVTLPVAGLPAVVFGAQSPGLLPTAGASTVQPSGAVSPGGAVGGSAPALPAAGGGAAGMAPGVLDAATVQSLMPNARGPLPLAGPPPGTPPQAGPPTPPTTTGSPIIK